jgi:hypothetical protein
LDPVVVGPPRVMRLHLLCIGSLNAPADPRRGEPKMSRAFMVLQLQRLESRMSWNAAVSPIIPTSVVVNTLGGNIICLWRALGGFDRPSSR